MKELRLFQKNIELFLLSFPAVVYILIFAYLPLVGLVLAFKDYRYDKGILGSDWVGFKNFEFFFTSQTAYIVTRNTILYNVAFILVGLVFALLFAVLLNEIARRWIKVHQTAMFLPYFLSWVVISYIITGFLDHEHGYFNQLLMQFGADPVYWYNESRYWPWILVAVSLWKGVGFSTLVYYAGILGIDSSYYEAARIDGATKTQMAMKITLPLLAPLISILMIMSIGGIFRADFGLFYFIPNDSSFLYSVTDVVDTYVFRALKNVGDIGMSTAVGFYQSVVGLVLVVLANYIIKKINDENSLW
ncbi:sugar ABC transporter permease [Paenibacillus antri]|uniref:Sugar ABC transporter permease n=2 Tax=Paenibacillus antri TaxID=2582848 RepID=A0A5R9G8D7_9BACL|nr:sugar ABC transporter permease [Paenibacillus antri]